MFVNSPFSLTESEREKRYCWQTDVIVKVSFIAYIYEDTSKAKKIRFHLERKIRERNQVDWIRLFSFSGFFLFSSTTFLIHDWFTLRTSAEVITIFWLARHENYPQITKQKSVAIFSLILAILQSPSDDYMTSCWLFPSVNESEKFLWFLSPPKPLGQ